MPRYKRFSSSRGTDSRINSIVNNFEGFHIDNSKKDGDDDDGDDDDESAKKKKTSEPAICDRQNAIKKMTGLFPEATTPTGEETESFVTRRLHTLGINPNHRLSVLFSLLTGPALLSCKNLHIRTFSSE